MVLELLREDPFLFIRVLAGFAVFLQSLELILARRSFSESGTWRWSTLQQEFRSLPLPARLVTMALLPYRPFLWLLATRALAAICLPFSESALIPVALALSTLIIAARWRGAFNGGSDYMTNVVLFPLALAALFPDSETISIGALYYIAVQSCASYFIAGFVKLRSENWRSGAALRAFLSSSPYQPSPGQLQLLCKRFVAVPVAWVIIGFETLFPLALIDLQFAIPLMTIAGLFHLGNVYTFGLNRFFWIWIASYPAVLWCAMGGIAAATN